MRDRGLGEHHQIHCVNLEIKRGFAQQSFFKQWCSTRYSKLELCGSNYLCISIAFIFVTVPETINHIQTRVHITWQPSTIPILECQFKYQSI